MVSLRTLRLGLAVMAALFVPMAALAASPDPYGDCCVAQVTSTGFNTWSVTCGSCAANPGSYDIVQPDPEKLIFTGPGGVTAESRYEAAQGVCKCPSQAGRRAMEQRMRTYDPRQ